MRIETEAIVCAVRAHAEHGAVVRLMTPTHGLQGAYVRGARGRRMRPVLIVGNRVQASLSARNPNQLPQATVELLHSRAGLIGEPLPALAIEWTTALVATALPEGHPYPRIHDALEGLLSAVEAAPAASGWGAALVRFELLLLSELGFGLDALPPLPRGSGQADWAPILDALALSGRLLQRDLLADRARPLGDARARLVERLRRAAGLP